VQLSIPTRSVKRFLLPVINATSAQIKEGIEVAIWDVDTNTRNVKSYILKTNWFHDFVRRRDLRLYDAVGLYWDPSQKCFHFSVLCRNIANQ